MKVVAGEAWAIIPARGGSKSITLKNLAPLGGRPLIEYVIAAGKASSRISRLLCSTDHEEIAHLCSERGVEVHWRPAVLAGDDIPILRVLQHMLRDLEASEGRVAEFMALLQPTSPFVLSEHIDACIRLLDGDPSAHSAQTISTFPHNFHAYNQRVVEGDTVRFRFPEEREQYYSKQTKPKHYVFGNVVVSRSETILSRDSVFGERSLPVTIPFCHATDVDGPDDLELAEWLLETGRVTTPLAGAAHRSARGGRA